MKKARIGTTSSLRKKRTKTRLKSVQEPKPIIFPPMTPRPKLITNEPPQNFISKEALQSIALNLARANSWRERQQHLKIAQGYFLSYDDLSTLIHRIPSLLERFKAIELLKSSVQDTPHQFYIFCQSFATEEERNFLMKTFQIELTNLTNS